eukprot:TRINITY_DN33178_c0_g1_i1.p1 TRINITY_DN33178_c0_g1~~TRINITY_DN33178_c0_g1_i1.p1  ORF type:complete len:182 (-),score=49.31 TRINITY_DN33178_c0_g1_i1:26-571(-)
MHLPEDYQSINDLESRLSVVDNPESQHVFPEFRVKLCSVAAAALCVLQPVEDYVSLSVETLAPQNAVFGATPVELIFDMFVFVFGLHGVVNQLYFPSLLYTIFSLSRAARFGWTMTSVLASAASPGSAVTLDPSLSLGVVTIVGLFPLAVVVYELRKARLRQASEEGRAVAGGLEGGVVVA